MKMMSKILVLFMASIFLFSALGMANASQATIAQSTLPLTTMTKDQCTTPTVFLNVGTAPAGTKYNVSTLDAPVSTCVKITFHNSDTVDHTFRIDANSADGVAYFNLYTNPSDTVSSNFMTPSKAMSITFYCAETGHYDKGMHGTLVVGSSGSSSPGFEAIPMLFGLFTVATIANLY